MRYRLILLIFEHPIQQGIRKGGGPHFCDGQTREERTRRGGMAYSRQLDESITIKLDHKDEIKCFKRPDLLLTSNLGESFFLHF